MKKGTSYFDSIKLNLVKRLFNPEILSRRDVSPADFSRVTGVHVQQYYRYFKRLHMEPKQGFKTDLSEHEIAQKLGNMMSFNELAALYEWAQQERFDRRKTVKKRAYRLTKSRQKKSSTISLAEQQSKNAQLIKNMGIDPIETAPVAKAAAAKIKQPQTTAEKLIAFMDNQDTTKQERKELIMALLGLEKPENESTAAMMTLALSDTAFNSYQWAIEQYLKTKGKLIRQGFLRGFRDDSANFGDDSEEQRILDAYRQNKVKFDLAKLEKIIQG